jgi:hypothetical protein
MTTGATGNCFDSAVDTFFKLRTRGARLMLGRIRSTKDEWLYFDGGKGMLLWHVWVENKGKVYDLSQGRKLLVERDAYYARYRVEEAMEYPMNISGDMAYIPPPISLPFVRDTIRIQYILGRRDFPHDVTEELLEELSTYEFDDMPPLIPTGTVVGIVGVK